VFEPFPFLGRKITREHAFFIIMGGYMGVTSGGDPIRPLTLRDLQLIDQNESHRLILRSIHDRDISDKSKNDPLGKSVALLQTLWFAVQAIVRLIQKLPLTAIEVTTLAFVALNVLTYFFWWHKPVDVDYPIRIQVDPEELDKRDNGASLPIPQCPPPSQLSQNDFNNPPDPGASPVDTHRPQVPPWAFHKTESSIMHHPNFPRESEPKSMHNYPPLVSQSDLAGFYKPNPDQLNASWHYARQSSMGVITPPGEIVFLVYGCSWKSEIPSMFKQSKNAHGYSAKGYGH
jgi:hypothetical protein